MSKATQKARMQGRESDKWFGDRWLRCYTYISRVRGIEEWRKPARLYDYLLYRSKMAQRFNLYGLRNMDNRLVMAHAGLNDNNLRMARDFLQTGLLIRATPEDGWNRIITYELYDPVTRAPFERNPLEVESDSWLDPGIALPMTYDESINLREIKVKSNPDLG